MPKFEEIPKNLPIIGEKESSEGQSVQAERVVETEKQMRALEKQRVRDDARKFIKDPEGVKKAEEAQRLHELGLDDIAEKRGLKP